ncbi:unnamed protein product [Phytophthora fragariaefolia]|uniref:Unnamed protein product n=1 Tax=Phytophthora fragariaefolia TaxID=1490495 RepID=A0A9W6XZ67_9STRA|nr:unnamed protein product [Phytophthora fragariaefolia]
MAYLLRHYPCVKNLNPDGLAIQRLEACALEKDFTVNTLLSWSSHLACYRNTFSAPIPGESQEPATDITEAPLFRHQAALIEQLIKIPTPHHPLRNTPVNEYTLPFPDSQSSYYSCVDRVYCRSFCNLHPSTILPPQWQLQSQQKNPISSAKAFKTVCIAVLKRYTFRVSNKAIRHLRLTRNATIALKDHLPEALESIFSSFADRYKRRIELEDIREWISVPDPSTEADDETEWSIENDLSEQPLHAVRKVLARKRLNRKTYREGPQ